MIEPRKIAETDCAYLAALIDMKGSVRIRSERRENTRYRKIMLVIGPLPKETAAWISMKFRPGRTDCELEGEKITYFTRRAAELCVHAYPYLLRRKEEVRLLTRFAQSMSQKGSRLSGEQEQIRVEVEKDLGLLHTKRRAENR
jgi:hypothetical protein